MDKVHRQRTIPTTSTGTVDSMMKWRISPKNAPNIVYTVFVCFLLALLSFNFRASRRDRVSRLYRARSMTLPLEGNVEQPVEQCKHSMTTRHEYAGLRGQCGPGRDVRTTWLCEMVTGLAIYAASMCVEHLWTDLYRCAMFVYAIGIHDRTCQKNCMYIYPIYGDYGYGMKDARDCNNNLVYLLRYKHTTSTGTVDFMMRWRISPINVPNIVYIVFVCFLLALFSFNYRASRRDRVTRLYWARSMTPPLEGNVEQPADQCKHSMTMSYEYAGLRGQCGPGRDVRTTWLCGMVTGLAIYAATMSIEHLWTDLYRCAMFVYAVGICDITPQKNCMYIYSSYGDYGYDAKGARNCNNSLVYVFRYKFFTPAWFYNVVTMPELFSSNMFLAQIRNMTTKYCITGFTTHWYNAYLECLRYTYEYDVGIALPSCTAMYYYVTSLLLVVLHLYLQMLQWRLGEGALRMRTGDSCRWDNVTHIRHLCRFVVDGGVTWDVCWVVLTTMSTAVSSDGQCLAYGSAILKHICPVASRLFEGRNCYRPCCNEVTRLTTGSMMNLSRIQNVYGIYYLYTYTDLYGYEPRNAGFIE